MPSIFGKLRRSAAALASYPATVRRAADLHERVLAMGRQVELMREALGRIEGRQVLAEAAAAGPAAALEAAEFRAFSQFGEDGIIHRLVAAVPVTAKTFVEFGADNYNEESNTRFLLTAGNWSGLVMDGAEENIRRLKASWVYSMHDLRAAQAFITRENIDALLIRHGVTGDVGLLSVDIDGNDYWVWEAMTVLTPTVVVVEYNYRWGADRAVVVPYQADFSRLAAHPSGVYFGASVAALAALGARRGYALVGCDSVGLNAFFVRRDRVPAGMRELTPAEAYRKGRYAEAIIRDGVQVKSTPDAEIALLAKLDLPVVEVG